MGTYNYLRPKSFNVLTLEILKLNKIRHWRIPIAIAIADAFIAITNQSRILTCTPTAPGRKSSGVGSPLFFSSRAPLSRHLQPPPLGEGSGGSQRRRHTLTPEPLVRMLHVRRAAAPSVPPLPVLEVAQLYERHGALGDDFTARVLNRAPLAVERNYALPGCRRAQKVVHRLHRGVHRGGRFQRK